MRSVGAGEGGVAPVSSPASHLFGEEWVRPPNSISNAKSVVAVLAITISVTGAHKLMNEHS